MHSTSKELPGFFVLCFVLLLINFTHKLYGQSLVRHSTPVEVRQPWRIWVQNYIIPLGTINSSWLRHTIWLHRTWSSLVQAMVLSPANPSPGPKITNCQWTNFSGMVMKKNSFQNTFEQVICKISDILIKAQCVTSTVQNKTKPCTYWGLNAKEM